MTVAITIITRNRAAVLPRAIESALAQDYAAREIWVLDDASEDETPSLAARYPGVRWQRSERRMGIPAARNRLMQTCGADLVVGLDDDAWFLEPDAISTGVAAMAADPRIGALAFDVVAPGRTLRHGRGEPQPWHAFQGCGHMLRMSAVREVGMYASTHGWYGAEEKDLSLRLLDAGHEIALLPGVHVWHDKSAIARDVPAQHASGVCNDMIFTFRRAPASVLAWLVPAKAASHIGFSLRHGLLRPCLEGLAKFAAYLPRIRASLRPVRMSTWREYRRRASHGPRPVVTRR